MAGGYQGAPKEGVEWLVGELKDVRRRLNSLASSAGIKSAVITDPSSPARIMLANGQIYMWDDYEADPEGYGLIYTDASGSANLTRIFPPHNSGTGLENSVTMRGTAPGTPGAFWMYTDGTAVLDSDGDMFIQSDDRFDTTTGARTETSAGKHTIDANGGLQINSGGSLTIFELPTTGSAANLRLDPGTASIQYVTSSRRYKQDIEDAPVDAEAFLKLRPRSWRDKGQVAADPETASRNVGFIAEEVDELGLPFVDYDDTGRPDALQYDRFMVGAVQVMQQQADQIKALTARLDALENN